MVLPEPLLIRKEDLLHRLWAHEALRIFHDRLVNDDDRRWFGNYLKAAVQEHLHLSFDEVFATPGSTADAGQLDVLSATRSLLYCNFLTQVTFSTFMCPAETSKDGQKPIADMLKRSMLFYAQSCWICFKKCQMSTEGVSLY